MVDTPSAKTSMLEIIVVMKFNVCKTGLNIKAFSKDSVKIESKEL